MKRGMRLAVACAAVAGVLVVGAAVSPALAYFTSYTTAKGGVKITVDEPDTKIEEQITGLTKTIKIVNTGEEPCFVRVRLIYPAAEYVTMREELGENWEKADDGYWYYLKVLYPGKEGENPAVDLDATTDLTVTFSYNKTEHPDYENNFHVIVAEEYTPALYNGEKEEYYPRDWTLPSLAASTKEEGD